MTDTTSAAPVAWRVHPFDYGIGHEGVYAMTQLEQQRDAWLRKGWKVEPLYVAPPAVVEPMTDGLLQQHNRDSQELRRLCAERDYAAGMGDPLVMAAPVAQGDALDAARYRFLAGHCRSTSEHWGGRWSIIVDGPAPKSHDSEDDFDAAIDAARSQAKEGE